MNPNVVCYYCCVVIIVVLSLYQSLLLLLLLCCPSINQCYYCCVVPLSIIIVVIIVVFSTINNSSSSTPGRPDISSRETQLDLQEKVGSNITLPCIYTANPTVRITKWHFLEFMNITSTIIFMGDTSGHYSVQTYSLTVYDLTAADSGRYTCNVTNQCGSDQTAYHVIIIGNL